MTQSTIKSLWQHSSRSQTIIKTLVKYGLGEWLSHTSFEIGDGILQAPDGALLRSMPQAERVRQCILELGTTFIKMGQILSTRPDLVGYEIAGKLKTLQDAVPAEDFTNIEKTLIEELGPKWQEHFSDFSKIPLAAASIGQVHLATIKGENHRVAIKIERRGIKEQIIEDLEIIQALAEYADNSKKLRFFQPSKTCSQLARTLRNELDYNREQQNMILLAKDFLDNKYIKVPKTFPDLTREKVLVMEFIDGIRPSDKMGLEALGVDLRLTALNGGKAYFEMIFVNGRFHADPHPGNFLLLKDNVIGLLDFGMIGHLPDRLREDFEDFLSAILNNDTTQLATSIFNLGHKPQDVNLDSFYVDISDFLDKYSNQSFDQFDLSAILRDMIEILVNYHIVLKPQVGLVLKVLIMLEGTAQILDPKFSAIDLIEPTLKKLQAKKLDPQKQVFAFMRGFRNVERTLRDMPEQVTDILTKLQKGRLKTSVQYLGLNAAINRLVLGILASAIFLGSALILAYEVPPLIFEKPTVLGIQNISLLGAFGCFFSLVLALVVTINIFRSGQD